MSYLGFDIYQPGDAGNRHADALHEITEELELLGIVNPCGEIPLNVSGGFCIIADLVPYFAAKDGGLIKLHQVARVVTRALIRLNQMPSLYRKETLRTNRIGVSMTGIHEWAWDSYGLDWYGLLGPESGQFWRDVEGVAQVICDEAESYSAKLGLPMCDTALTIKPSGTVSKLFALTEGAHLPAMVFYLRWVQFRKDDRVVQEYINRGYPVRRDLKTYRGTSIVGFPTKLELGRIMPPEQIVTASEATMEDQFEWVRRLERYWLSPTGHENRGGQVSYTMKYDPNTVTQDKLAKVILENMPTIRAVSIMPQEDVLASGYEYLPEEPVSPERFADIEEGIDREDVIEDIGKEHTDCPTGACPVTFNTDKL